MNQKISPFPCEQYPSAMLSNEDSMEPASVLAQKILGLVKAQPEAPAMSEELSQQLLSALRTYTALNPPCETYSAAEVAKILGAHPCTVYNLAVRGYLTPLEGMRHLRFHKEKVHDYVAGKTKSPATTSSSVSYPTRYSSRKRRARRNTITPT